MHPKIHISLLNEAVFCYKFHIFFDKLLDGTWLHCIGLMSLLKLCPRNDVLCDFREKKKQTNKKPQKFMAS